jgi:hypothetical protein
MLVGKSLLSVTPNKSLIPTYLIEGMPSEDWPLTGGERDLILIRLRAGLMSAMWSAIQGSPGVGKGRGTTWGQSGDSFSRLK